MKPGYQFPSCRAAKMGAAMLLALASAWAAAATSPAPNGERHGMHVVFDASGSMCGFVKAHDDRVLLPIARITSSWKSDAGNDRVLLLRQPAGNTRESSLRAQGDLESYLADPRSECRDHFDGAGSDLARIFEAGPMGAPSSIVIVTDLQLGDLPSGHLADAVAAWLREVPAQQPVSAGLVTLGANFAGPYYAVDTDGGPATKRPAKPQKPTVLPMFQRPLTVLWFAVGADHVRRVRDLLGAVGIKGAAAPSNLLYGVQLAPWVTEDRRRWLQVAPTPASADALFTAPALKVDPGGSGRDPVLLRECAKVVVANGELVLRARPSCSDGRPFFDAVPMAEVSLGVDPQWNASLAGASPPAAVRDNRLAVRFDRRTTAGTIALQWASASGPSSSAKLSAMTLDNDGCEALAGQDARERDESAWAGRCASGLQGHVYRYRQIVDALSERARDIANGHAATLPATLRFRLDFH